MDYMREEFLRQRRALERLMTGNAKRTEMEAAVEEVQAHGAFGGAGTENVGGGGMRIAPVPERSGGRMLVSGVESGVLRQQGGIPAALAASSGAAAAERLSVVAQAEMTNARAVSRAIQRDARRYDGGFSLY